MTDRQIAWDIYFASVVGISLHPGAGERNHKKLGLAECAEIADQMLREREIRAKYFEDSQ